MRLLLVLLTGLFLLTHTSTLQANIKLVLLGIVLEKGSLSPAQNVKICITPKFSKKHTCFTTLADGYFKFPLEKDKEYLVELLNEENNVLDSKEISTLGKDSPETMHLIFEYKR
ncbi:MAG: hypothetical protein ACPG49_02200 [Chitinophagales bacterium]